MTPRALGARVRTLALGVAVLAALLIAPAQAFAGHKVIALSNGQIKFYDVSPGKTVTGTVQVSNEGDTPLKVLVYAGDQEVSPTGELTFTVPNREDLTAYFKPSTWVTLKMPANSKSFGNIPYLDLKPGDRVPVSFSITPPPNVPPGDHNLYIFFEMYEPPNPTTGASGEINGRLGARITLRVKGPIQDNLQVKSLTVPPYVIGTSFPYQITLANEGNIDKRVSVGTGLYGGGGSLLATSQPLTGGIVYAQTSKDVTATITASKFAFGHLYFRVQVLPVDDVSGAAIPNAKSLNEVVRVWMAPLWLLITIGVLIVVVFIGLVWWIGAAAGRRRERRRAAAAAAQPAPLTPAAPPTAPAPTSDDGFYDPDKGE